VNQQQWAQGAIDAMAPNVTRPATWANANAFSDPTEKLKYILSQSPPGSDQMPLYNNYVASHPQTGAATAPVVSQTPVTTATNALAVRDEQLRQLGGDAVPASAGHERAQQHVCGARGSCSPARR
jgi:hypothetical protein